MRAMSVEGVGGERGGDDVEADHVGWEAGPGREGLREMGLRRREKEWLTWFSSGTCISPIT
jgi:hypothetical protein